MSRLLLLSVVVIPSLFLSIEALALPIDWQGVFGVDTTSINNYRRIEQTTDRRDMTSPGGLGSQEIPLADGGQRNSSWQNYLFRLEPIIIINDTATFKGELSSGYARGGYFGSGFSQSQTPGLGDALYPYNFSGYENGLVLNKFFVELYADTSTYQIGRHSYHYGLGAVANAGEDEWDRFSFVRDGLTIKVRLGNFTFSPFWARVGNGGTLTKVTKVKEYGLDFVYENVDRDLSFGLLYAKKRNSAFNQDIRVGTGGDLANLTTTGAIGKVDIKITDLFIAKSFGDFNVGLEIPILSGVMGGTRGSDNGYKAKGFIFESDYKLSNNWTLFFNGGQVSGEDGDPSAFGAMYLNPNYQVANLLFRYNLAAVSDPNNRSVYDSYITNTRYLKLGGIYSSDKWVWDFAVIKAWAEETAEVGAANNYNHTIGRRFAATEKQSDDMGTELDVNFDYRWNSEVNIGGSLGYLVTGDYWAYTNDPNTVNVADSSYVLQLRTSVNF